ncbi:hypothetical protein SAMN05428945_5163 [Streptomyces sp. 2224.1]|nr:hypothetical protein SAMN05428945_5163 [Streptomyces sp. 2224.1]
MWRVHADAWGCSCLSTRRSGVQAPVEEAEAARRLVGPARLSNAPEYPARYDEIRRDTKSRESACERWARLCAPTALTSRQYASVQMTLPLRRCRQPQALIPLSLTMAVYAEEWPAATVFA